MNLQRLFFSHYVYNGVGGAVGVFLAGVIGYFFGGWPFAAAMSTGAVVVHLVDAPCPPSLKIRQVVPILLIDLIITLFMLAGQALWWQLLCIVLVTAASSTLSAFGKAAMPYSFSLIYAMMMGLAVPLPSWPHIFEYLLLFTAGGVLYILYVIAKEYALELRSKQQILAECLHEFSSYLLLKSQLFNTDKNEEQETADSLYAKLIRQQAVLTEKLQDSRNILFQRIRPEHGGYLSATLFAVFDAYESALSSQSDLNRLRQHEDSQTVLKTLGEIVRRSADDLDQLAESVMRNTAPAQLPDYSPQLAQAAQQLEALTQEKGHTTTVTLLRELIDKVRMTLEHIVRLSHTTCSPSDPQAAATLELDQQALQAFISPSHFQFSALRTHLRGNSPAMRYTVRMTLAMITGFLIADILPYGAHSYWVMLTIAVILRSSYSQTKQRGADRIVGTLIGCVIAGAVLYLFDRQFFLLICLFLAIAIARAMVTIRYRYTSAAATVMGMVQIHMLNPGAEFLIGERLIDTLIGAALAYLFSFVLPNWEHRNLPQQVQRLTDNCLTYARQALALNPTPMDYRLTRRQFHDSLAAFSQTIDRMLGEPKFRQLPLSSLENTATQGYLLAAQMAAVRTLLTTRGQALPTPQTEQQLAQACEQIVLTIEQPRGAPRRAGKKADAEMPLPADPNIAPTTLLQRRLEQICQEAIPFAAALKRVLKSHRRMQKKFTEIL